MKIAIIGGGIGGLATAISLLRAGHAVEVFERAPEIGEVGAGLSLWPNATHALQELGVLKECLLHASPFTEIRVFRAEGKCLMELPVGTYATPAIAMHRADLVSVLMRNVPSDRLNLGRAVTALEEEPNGVFLIAGSKEFGPYEAVIGADGLHSVARSYVRGSRMDQPEYRGYAIWRGVAHLQIDLPGFETWGRGSRFGALRIGDGRVYWYATQNQSLHDANQSEDRSEHLLKVFGSWHRPVRELIESTPPSAILKNLCFDRNPFQGWSRGRVLLVGDAAHPTTPNMGQGGCMALEDAMILPRVLKEAPDVAQAFLKFEKLRFSRTAKIMKESRQIGDLGQLENKFGIFLRDLATSAIPGKLLSANYRGLYGYTG